MERATVNTTPRRSGTEKNSGRGEARLMNQLLVSVVLFLAVCFGRSAYPEQLGALRGELLDMMTGSTDFRAAFTQLGESMRDRTDVLDELNGFCAEVFGPGSLSIPTLPEAPAEPAYLPESEIKPPVPPVPAPEPATPTAEKNTEQKPAPVRLSESKSAVPAVGTVLMKADYHGPALSARDTMDQLSLGDLDTTTPVMGRLTSKYGWRTHPISKKQHFHGGTDISGKEGAPIGAFADGIVEYIGRDNSYGIYLQLDHGNGVKSFYAHCSKLCAEKGQRVKKGEKIAEVGSTGCSTGPHLHLELKCGNKRLNPAYYIRFTNQ